MNMPSIRSSRPKVARQSSGATTHARDAAEALRLTANRHGDAGCHRSDCGRTLGAAHRDPEKAIDNLGEALEEQLSGLNGLSGIELVNQRQEKYLAIGDKGPDLIKTSLIKTS